MGTLSAQLLLQIYTDQLETLACRSVDVHVDMHAVLALTSIKVLLLFSSNERLRYFKNGQEWL